MNDFCAWLLVRSVRIAAPAVVLVGVIAASAEGDTLIPVVTGGTVDQFPTDGRGDQLDDTSFIAVTNSGDYRAIVEYDVRDVPAGTVLSATLAGTVGPNNSVDVGLREHLVEVYTGNGTLDLDDHHVPGIEVGRFSHASGDSTDFEYDIQGVLHNLLAAGADFIGMRISGQTDPLLFDVLYTNESFPDAPRLHFELLPEGSETVQLTPVVDAEVAFEDNTWVVNEGEFSIGVQRIDFADVDRRGVVEYDLSSIPAGATITDAKLTLDPRSFSSSSDNGPDAPVYAYAGDGQVEVDDALMPSSQVGVVSIRELEPTTVDLDHAAIQSLIGEASHLGVTIHGDPDYNSFSFASLEFGAPPFNIPPALLTLTYLVPVALAGDYNGDGTVDAADYTLWRDSIGATGTGLAADGNGDSVVDALDYNIWKTNFGQTAAVEPLTAQVPEPASGVAMLLLAALAVAIGRRTGGK